MAWCVTMVKGISMLCMALLFSAVAFASARVTHAVRTEPSHAEQAVYGQWQVVKAISASREARLSGEDIESLMGAKAHYEANDVDFAGERCERPVYDSYRETAKSLAQDHELQVEDVEFSGDTVLAVEIGCADGNEEFVAGTWLLVAAPDRLITEVEGVYFELKRIPLQP